MDNTKNNFNDYDFLRLYCFTKISKGDSKVIDSEKLGNILFYFYDDPKYSDLFDNMELDKEDNFVFVDLHKAIAKAYTNGILDLQVYSDGPKLIITASTEEANKLLESSFKPEYIKTMNELYDESKLKEPILSKLIEIRKLETQIRLAEELIEVNKQLQLELEEEILKEQEKNEIKRIRKKDANN